MLTSIFGLTSIFSDVACSKIPKHEIFGKSAGKVLKKWGGGTILIDYFESYAKMKKTPLNTLEFFVVGYAFFWCLFSILNFFEKTIFSIFFYVNTDVNFRS